MSDADASTTVEDPPRGFQIRGRFYPVANDEKLGDPVIVREVTGLSWDAYQAAFGIPDPSVPPDEQEPAEVDESLMLVGMVALAVAHANPGWNRARIVSFVSQLDAVAVELVGFDVEPDEVDPEEAALPPTRESDVPSPAPLELIPGSGDSTGDETAVRSPEPQD